MIFEPAGIRITDQVIERGEELSVAGMQIPDRGCKLETPLAPLATETIHPSAVLRIRERTERHDALAAMVEDLRSVVAELRLGPS